MTVACGNVGEAAALQHREVLRVVFWGWASECFGRGGVGLSVRRGVGVGIPDLETGNPRILQLSVEWENHHREFPAVWIRVDAVPCEVVREVCRLGFWVEDPHQRQASRRDRGV